MSAPDRSAIDAVQPMKPEPTMNHPHPSAADGHFFSGRQRLILRRIASFSLLTILLLFWGVVVYTTLVAGWWLFKGYSFVDETQNAFVWNSLIDWMLMGLALLSVWPAQRWLRTQIAHFVEDNSDESYAIISQLSEQIDSVQTADAQMSSLAYLLARTLNVPYVCIETEADGLSTAVGELSAAPPITLPLTYNQRRLGTLQIAPRVVAGAPLHVDRQLLIDLARQVSATLYATRLSIDLQESRRRIVTAREEARRQLRRDLHDGLGPSLAAMTMQADTARELVYDDPELTEQLLTNFVEQTQIMVADVRRIVHGLRPPALDDVGLFGALELLVNSFSMPGLRTSIRLPATKPTLSAATEVAIYRIVQEGLTNVSKHAQAQSAVVALESDDRNLTLSIEDDGIGLSDEQNDGMGLHNMRERAEELGGALSLRSNAPTGSRIVVRLPLETGESNGTDPHSDL